MGPSMPSPSCPLDKSLLGVTSAALMEWLETAWHNYKPTAQLISLSSLSCPAPPRFAQWQNNPMKNWSSGGLLVRLTALAARASLGCSATETLMALLTRVRERMTPCGP